MLDLPPLNSLRAFESAARNSSFALAAAELHVSAGAISRHIKLLEGHLGQRLFVRMPNGVRLTEAAERLWPEVNSSFKAIAQVTANVANTQARLRILASPTMANRWLIPRLHTFKSACPDITVSVGTLRSSHDEFFGGEFDVGIATFGSKPTWTDGLFVEPIRSEELTPMAAPSLLNRDDLTTPDDLLHHTMLQVASCLDDWPRWLDANGCSARVDTMRAPTYDTGEMALTAAVEGLGVTLMDRMLTEPELASGTLVDLFPKSTPITNGYHFFCLESRRRDTEITSFRSWLLKELSSAR